MPHCPRCRAEYADGRDECIDCGVALVDDWSEEVDDDENGDRTSARFVPLRTYPSRVHAEMIVELLSHEGIPAVIKSDEVFGASTGIGTGSTPRITVLVPADQLEDAKAIADGSLDSI